jgi:hypothetical protein
LPILFLAQSLLFLILLAFLVFLGTEVSEARQLILRGAIFIVVGFLWLFTAAIGFFRGEATGRLRRFYGGVSLTFLFSLIAVQVWRAVAVYPKARRVRWITEWYIPRTNREAWWEGVRGPLHEFEYLVATLIVLAILLVVFLFVLRWRPKQDAPRGG